MKSTTKYLFFSLAMILSFATFSQQLKSDSLKIVLRKTTSDTLRCRLLNLLIENENDDNIWPRYNDTLISIAQKNLEKNNEPHFYKKMLAVGLNNKGVVNGGYGKVAEALSCYAQALKIGAELNDEHVLATAYNNFGSIYTSIGEASKALEYYDLSLSLRKNLSDKKEIAVTYDNMADIFDLQGNVSRSLDYYISSLKLREEVGDKAGIAISLNNIGSIYDALGDTAKALEYYYKSLNMQREIGDKYGEASSLNNIGLILYHRKDHKQAEHYYNQSLKIREELNDRYGIANSYNNLGVFYSNYNNIEKAIEFHFKSLQLRKEIDDKKGIASSLGNIGALYLRQGKNDLALDFATDALEKSRALGYPEVIRNVARVLKNTYEAKGDFTNALAMQELFIQMKDSISNSETRRAGLKKQFEYEYGKKAIADSIKVVEERKITAVKLKQEKTKSYALYGSLAMVILFAGFMFNRFKVAQKQKNIIDLQKREVELQKDLSEQQKTILEVKQKEILDSIRYAKRIQQSLLTNETLLARTLERARTKK